MDGRFVLPTYRGFWTFLKRYEFAGEVYYKSYSCTESIIENQTGVLFQMRPRRDMFFFRQEILFYLENNMAWRQMNRFCSKNFEQTLILSY
jgi:hypothetical protein